MAAEAVLDELTRADRAVIAGAPVQSVTQEELLEAAGVLRTEALEAIDKSNPLSPSLANNAALALRFADDLDAASRILDAGITEKELREEVEKAKTFRPRLSEFILATTAPRDQAIQTAARLITEELRSAEFPMRMMVWGWEDIEENASQYDQAYNAFDPTYSPHAQRGFERLEQTVREGFERLGQQQTQASTSAVSIARDEPAENTPLHGMISAYLALIDDGHVRPGLVQLERLRAAEWANAGRTERYRLAVAIASATLKLGDQVGAGRQLLEAYKECPEHKRAKQNLAKAHLLCGDHQTAISAAIEVLHADARNADAASTLIQARIHDASCLSPLDAIPSELLETEDVLVARIHFERCRNDLAWIARARDASLPSESRHRGCSSRNRTSTSPPVLTGKTQMLSKSQLGPVSQRTGRRPAGGRRGCLRGHPRNPSAIRT